MLVTRPAVLGSVEEEHDHDGMFTSLAEMEGLLWTEAEVVRKLEQYVQEEYKRLEKLETILLEYKRVRDRAAASSERFIGNPLNSFLLIKKLTSDWKLVQDLVEGGGGEHFLNNITSERHHHGLKWPKDEDLNGAAIGK